MSELDVAAIIAYLRSLGPAGPRQPQRRWDLRERALLLDGRIVPSVLAARDTSSSLDLGPRYDGGRYLARIACGECHGTDLAGAAGAPDLDIVSHYNRPEFFDLLRRGIGAHGRRVPAMSRLASVRFRVLEDYEIMALLDYLGARAHAPADLIARANANEKRRRAQSAVENQD
jgi:cytochrome c553